MESMAMRMEGKRLDFDAPLISVRRFIASPSPPSPALSRAAAIASSGAEDGGRAAVAGEGWQRRCYLPFYKSELKSGPVRSPGTVPFVWEQSPGRPKDSPSGHGGVPAKPMALVAAKPPPGGPFPISSSGSASPAISTPSSSSTSSSSSNGTALSTSTGRSSKASKVKPKPKPAVAKALVLKKQHGARDDEDGEGDALSVAQDARSRAESCFVNCSTTRLGGAVVVQGPSRNPQAREFMMGRFLPAAQAMTTDSPQRPVGKPQTPGRTPARRVSVDGGSPRSPAAVLLPYHFLHRPSYAKNDPTVRHSSVGFGGDDDDEDAAANLTPSRRSVKGCGWLPKLCLRGSLGRLNPIPVMKVRGGRLSNCSDRTCELAAERRSSFTEGLMVKAREDKPLHCRVPAAVAPDELLSADPSSPEERMFYIEEVPRKDRVLGVSQLLRVEEQGKGSGALEDLPPLALPRTPSESWLCQALPSVTAKSSTPQSPLRVHLPAKRQVTRASTAEPRWETGARTPALPKSRMRFADVVSSLVTLDML